MDRKYFAIIGDDEFQVTGRSNREAQYKTARLFRIKHNLKCDLSMVIHFATATMLPDPEFTTKRILALIAEMEKAPV